MRRLVGSMSVLALVSLAQPAWADNTTLGGAYSLMIGGHPSEAFLDNFSTERWYRTYVVAGRSYCVETQGGVLFDTDPAAGTIDTFVLVLRQDANTVLVSNDDAMTEPQSDRTSRGCFTAPVNESVLIRVNRSQPGTSFGFRVRMVESTLFSNWFFVGGDYSAFTLVRNTTNTPINYTIKWRNSGGTIVGTTSGALGGDGSIVVDGRSFPAVIAAVSGTVEIAHTGSPDAIVASTTVLSGTTGLSFDAPFMKRTSW
jgi:hypothetical protein